jgi:crotonobetainyl-CoA:carnitine CoA-transferase CaiB-like acyl-CoA transferase
LDLAIIEPILTILGPQPIVYDQLGIVQTRTGNRSINNAPRNTYQTADGKWVAISTSTQSIAERVMHLVGHPEIIEEPWFASGAERAQHAEELDAYVSDWILQRDIDDVIVAFEEAHAAVAPIYDIRQIMEDPQYAALGSIVSMQDPDLGTLRMQNVMFRMSETPGEIRWAGRGLGQDNAAVFGDEFGLSEQELDVLREKGVM